MGGKAHYAILFRILLAHVIGLSTFGLCSPSLAQQSITRGTITGLVTADQGDVRAFRVAAHNLDERIWYIVFTKKGKYIVPQALPGHYELMVNEPGYDSPKLPVQLESGETKTADLVLKSHSQTGNYLDRGNDEAGPQRRRADKVVFVNSLEDVFPPGPALDLLKQNCTGCHADEPNGWGAMHYTKDRFLRGIERMTETGPANEQYALALGKTVISKSQKEMLADYLFNNFGPDKPDKRLKIDPLLLDEDVASKAIYVSYDIPADLEMEPNQGPQVNAPMVDGVIAQIPGLHLHHLQQAIISPIDGTIFFSSRVSNSVLRLYPKEQDPLKRWQNYPIKGDNHFVGISGMAIDSRGHVYWSELKGGMLGELDPISGKQIQYRMPEQGSNIAVVVDKDDNVGFAYSWGAMIGRIDAATRTVHVYPTPTPDNGIYGLAADQKGDLWGAGWTKGTISEWDVETQAVKEYKVPNSWGQVRRIGVDSKGMVWGSEYITGLLAKLDPATGEITEYKIPVSGAKPYDAWPDKSDNVWTGDEVHSALVKFDQKNRKFTFYPMPQPHQSVPKFDIERNQTIWFGTRNEPIITGVHFYPDGYTKDAPPLP